MIHQIRNNILMDSQDEYNCSFAEWNSTVDWDSRGTRRPVFGIFCIFYAVLVIPIYSIILFVMREFLNQSCYKIMIYLGIVDCGMIFCNSGMVGMFLLKGSVYCQNPKMNFVYSMICYLLYFSSSFTCFVLGLNRLAELLSIRGLMASFKGRRTWLLLLLPTMYGSYAAFCSPLPFFNSNLHVFLFDPMIGNHFVYANVFHSWNNLFFPTTTMLMYGFMAYKIRRVQSKTTDAAKQEAMDRAKIMASYVILQFIPSLEFSLYATHIGWMLVHGLPPFVYLLFNRSIRIGVAQSIAPMSSHNFPSYLNHALNR